MQTRIMATGIELSRSTRAYVHQRLGMVLKRHAQDLQHVDVFIKDHNGPKGGKDTSAILRVRLADGRLVTVEDVQEEVHIAVARVAQRMAFAIRRALQEGRRIDRRKAREARRDIGGQGSELDLLGDLARA